MTDENPETLRDAAAGWRDMGRQLRDIVQELDREVGAARGTHWQGPAADAFGADWAWLKHSVEETLPVFDLAAAALEDEADTGDRAKEAPDAERPEPQDTGMSAMHGMYAANALAQMVNGLGSAFGRKQDGRQQGSRPTAPSEPGRSAAPNATLGVFGPPAVAVPAKERPSGGLGVAAGARTTPPAGPAEAGTAPAAPARAPEDSAAAGRPRSDPDPRSYGAFG